MRRKEGEEVRTFVNRFNTAYKAVAKKSIMIPESARPFILVQKAVITNEIEQLVIHKIYFKKD